MPAGANAEPGELARYVASEVRAELKRQKLSMRSLAGFMPGKYDYVKERLGDGARYALDLNDLDGIERLLHVSPHQFIERAAAQMNADALKALEDQAVRRLTRPNEPGDQQSFKRFERRVLTA
jgi:hypothetical protein